MIEVSGPNRRMILDDDGKIKVHYDKMHGMSAMQFEYFDLEDFLADLDLFKRFDQARRGVDIDAVAV